MSELHEDERALLARLTPEALRLSDNGPALLQQPSTLTPHEQQTLMDWAQRQHRQIAQRLARLDAAFNRIDRDLR